ncbi:MAG: T9SS type A sorting domain-containing protein, partial [Bacteroidales bacterium]
LTANFEAIDYNLTLIVNPVEGGSVTGDGVYNVDDVVSLSATSNEGYQFVNWTDESETEISTQASFDYPMPAANTTLTANFELIDYNVTVAVDPAGAGTISGDGVYNMGDEVVVNATANEGFLFVNWTNSESTEVSVDAEYIFTMPAADVELTANFEEETSIADFVGNNISLYPNPAKTSLNISSDMIIIELHILNISGELVYKETVNNKDHVLSLDGLNSGMYFVRILTEKGYILEKIQVID